MEGDPDRKLVERWWGALVEEDRAALAIIDRFSRPVAGFFHRKGHPQEDLQELTQETFLRVFQGLEGYRGSAPFGFWVLLVAQNVHYSVIRKRLADKRQRQEVPLDAQEAGQSLQLPADLTSPEEEFLEKEREAALRQAIAELTPQRKRCLELHVYRSRKIQEIAQELGISPETVKAHLHQARQKLGKELARYFAEPGF